MDRVGRERDRRLFRHLRLPLRFEDGHRGEAAAAHGHVGEFVGAAVGVHGEEAYARGVDAGDDEVRADVALVAEEVLLEHRHDGHDAGFAAGGEGVQFEVGGDEGGGEFGVGGCAGARAPDLGGDVVEFFAVLVYCYLSLGGLWGWYWGWVWRWGGGEVRLTLSATIGPEVARVSAAITTPPSYMQPTIVVPVLVALGSGTPWAWRAALRL